MEEFFNFDEFEDEYRDAGLVANNHLFEDGPGFYSEDAYGSDESMSAAAFRPAQVEHVHGMAPHVDSDNLQTGLVPMPDQSLGAPPYPDNIDPSLVAVPVPSTSTIPPTAAYGGLSSHPQIVPGPPPGPQPQVMNPDQQQLPQTFTYSLQHSVPSIAQIAQMPLNFGGNQFNNFQPLSQSQEVAHSPQNISAFASPPYYRPAQGPSQAEGSSQQQDFLTAEQIQSLQNVSPEPAASKKPSGKPFTAPKKTKSGRSTRTVPPASTPAQNLQAQTQAQGPLAGLTFTSLRDAETAMSTREIKFGWTPPFPDPTIPTTQAERSAYVLLMLNAFLDTSECKDNLTGRSFSKRWTTSNYYKVEEMEKVCWSLLDFAVRLHTHGPAASSMYCPVTLKKMRKSRKLDFQQRIDAVCNMMKFSKAYCDTLMKGEGIEALVGAPKQKMICAKTMVDQNMRRQKWIAHGRKEDKTYAPGTKETPKPVDNGDEVLSDHDEIFSDHDSIFSDSEAEPTGSTEVPSDLQRRQSESEAANAVEAGTTPDQLATSPTLPESPVVPALSPEPTLPKRTLRTKVQSGNKKAAKTAAATVKTAASKAKIQSRKRPIVPETSDSEEEDVAPPKKIQRKIAVPSRRTKRAVPPPPSDAGNSVENNDESSPAPEITPRRPVRKTIAGPSRGTNTTTRAAAKAQNQAAKDTKKRAKVATTASRKPTTQKRKAPQAAPESDDEPVRRSKRVKKTEDVADPESAPAVEEKKVRPVRSTRGKKPQR
ncbi:hypothetical protein C7974DRAFT_469759 [Boeremia exigua]|uniref:uncharacterized protein n=1 Tax=Boeremia exigua TaxID=749465 RepID=UPI001E8D3530|nr:uncharacterized protein C7974DRAFT_469759 [Boeremia exigua]KAH6639180.1 hypothetical protein C7974DRAFT_469759 [Boeremia exigua]